MDNTQIMKVIYKNRIKYTDYISVFVLIYLPSSFFGISMKGSLNLVILLSTALITIVINNKKLLLDKKSLMFFLSIVILSSFTMIMNMESPYHYIIFWASLLSAYLFFLSFDVMKFIYIYTKLMYVLSVFSLLSFALLLTVPNIFVIFPTITNMSGLTVNNLIFSVVHNDNYFNANYGIFWEPGAFQTFINLALYFQLFVLKDINIKKITIFLITLFTTFSTTGYLSALFLFIIYLISNKDKMRIVNKKRRKLYKAISLLIFIGAVVFSVLPNKIVFKVFGKLEVIVNPNLINQNIAYGSTTSRIDAIKIPLINFFDSPIWGKGFENLYNYTINDNINFLTATPLNWFGLFGLVFGILLNYSIWRLTSLSNNSIFSRILEFIFFNLIMLSEYYNTNGFILALVFFGFSYKVPLDNNRDLVKGSEL